MREVFGHEACFIEARDRHGSLTGVLPLIRQKHFLLGNFATSIPFFNYGGALVDSEATAAGLMQYAVDVARNWGCSHVEFRDNRTRTGNWSVRTDKVSMILALPSSFEVLSRQLGAKLRSQVKRADREGASTRVGGLELLDAFYDVFCRNMRDLGTPVYPRGFFEALLRRFPEQTLIVCLNRGEQPAAAAFLVLDGTRAEVPWASCRNEMKPLGFNMKLYSELLSTVIARGCTVFDFGRSTVNSGTYRFKEQWGAKPVQLYWHRWERDPRVSLAPEGSTGFMRRMPALWSRLPLPVTRFLGPFISPSLPW